MGILMEYAEFYNCFTITEEDLLELPGRLISLRYKNSKYYYDFVIPYSFDMRNTVKLGINEKLFPLYKLIDYSEMYLLENYNSIVAKYGKDLFKIVVDIRPDYEDLKLLVMLE